MPSSRPPLPRPPRASRFRIVRELGVGAQGAVHEAIDLELDAPIAIKTLRSLRAEEIVRLKTEFRAVRDLEHPNLVRLGELIEEGGRWYFTMELVRGTDFLTYVRGVAALEDSASWPTRVESGPRTRVAARGSSDARDAPTDPAPPPPDPATGACDEERLRAALGQLAGAVAFLHRNGKVHCDLKPSNVLVDRDGRVVLIDFGVTSELALPEAEEHAIVGTVPYMAPEQVLGTPVSPATDWYAAGVLLFEALTGRRPIEGEANDVMERKCLLDPPRPSELAPAAPADLDALCIRMLARDPEARPSDADVLRALGVGESSDGAVPVFVGRERELATLAEALAAVRAGTGVSVFLEGESGVGKSALARRFIESARRGDRKVTLLQGRCHEQERVPYNAFDAVLDSLARYLRGRLESERAALLPPDVDRLRRVFPALGGLSETRDEGAPRGHSAASRLERAEAFATVRELFRRIARRRTLIVLVEDIQWADSDSLALLEALTDEPEAPAALLLATARPRPDGTDCAAFSAARGQVRRVRVGGLDAGDAARLLEQLLAQRRDEVATSDQDLTSILQSSRGHPLFLEELARYVERPRARREAATVDDAICARVDELDPETRDVLEVIAVAGASTPQSVIAEAAGMPFAAYAKSAAALHTARLVRVRGTRSEDAVEPYHDRVREAVYARLEAPARASIHRALGATLERQNNAPDLLHHHFEAGGDVERAARYAERAADLAARALAFERAATLYRSALQGGSPDPERRRRLLTALGQSLVDAGRSKEAGDAYLEASRTGVQMARRHSLPSESVTGVQIARRHSLPSESVTGVQIARRHSLPSESVTGAPAEDVRLDLLRRAGEQLLMSGHLRPGLAAVAEVLDAFGLSLPTRRTVALARLGWYRWRLARSALRWPARSAEQVTKSAAARIDLCWSVGAGLGLVDSIRSILFVDLGALLAVAEGDELRIARALSAAAVGEGGLGHRSNAARLGEACRRAAEGAGTDRARFYATLASATYRFFLENDWRGCVEGTREAQRLLANEGRTEGWETDVVEQFACWSLDNMGRFRELRARVPAKIRAAQKAGNRFIEVNFRTQFVNLHLIDDRPDDARRDVLDAIASWPRVDSEIANQDYLALRNLTYVALYQRDLDELARKEAEWARYFGSLLSRVAFLRQDALFWSGAAALVRARAGRGGERARGVRIAARAVRDLERFDLPMAAANALHLRAGIAACAEDFAAARDALSQALVLAERQATELHAACIRWRLAEVLAGKSSQPSEEARGLAAMAREWMKAEEVRAPERLVEAVLPGW